MESLVNSHNKFGSATEIPAEQVCRSIMPDDCEMSAVLTVFLKLLTIKLAKLKFYITLAKHRSNQKKQ